MGFAKSGICLGLSRIGACFIALAVSGQVLAQDARIGRGAVAITSSSGTIKDVASGADVIDLSGPVLRLVSPQAGTAETTARQLLAITAAQLGQVDGIAIDSGSPARIFVAASAVHGLYRNDNNAGWAQGMWAPEGGPGSIYVLSEADNFAPKLLLNVTLDDRENSGAGLGALAFNPKTSQLFASDLESGMIFRIDASSGKILDTYDHGVDGRSYFFAADTKKYEVRDIVSFNPASKPLFGNCGEGRAAEAAKRFSADRACWNIADYRRRVWALAVAQDEEGEQRLYYAVWGAAALGNGDWSGDSEGGANSIWSVGLDRKGAFDLKEVRRELVLPRVGQEQSLPIASLSFPEPRRMFAAERYWPGIAGGETAAQLYFFRKGTTGSWNTEPSAVTGSVGAGTGFALDGSGSAAGDDPSAWLNTIGGVDCQADGACTPASRIIASRRAAIVAGPIGGASDAASVVKALGTPDKGPTIGDIGSVAVYAGEQILPAASETTTEPPAAAPEEAPAPATEQPQEAAEPEQPESAEEPAQAGPAEEPEAAPEQPEQPEEPEVVETPPPDVKPVEPSDYDLATALEVPSACDPGGVCAVSVSLRNAGDSTVTGLIGISGEIGEGLRLPDASPDGWSCSQRGQAFSCLGNVEQLAAGAETRISLALSVSNNGDEPRVRVCASPLTPAGEERDQIRLVQQELKRRGFDPGVPDGVMGRRTADAIRQAEQAFNLPVTGQISDDLLGGLFGEQVGLGKDTNTGNDLACARISVDWPDRPVHQLQISAFHRKLPSNLHDARTSSPARVHDEIMSAFHAQYRSSAHDGRTTRPRLQPVHDPRLSRFHNTYESSLHDGNFSDVIRRHAPSRSRFHDRAPSQVHDIRTSRPLGGIHQPSLSVFHESFRSSAHDGRFTRSLPVHDRRQSGFHQEFDSRLHETASSRHRTGLSSFHGRFESRFHDRFSSGLVPFYRGRHDGFFSTVR